jgi:hypothetical protein
MSAQGTLVVMIQLSNVFVIWYYKMEYLFADLKKNRDGNSLNPKMSEEEKAKVVIQKAKVEDDEYKNYTEEQTYYRFVKEEQNNI